MLDRLELSGDETVLDAGCGSGRVTRLLVERVPRGRVIGVDASPSMIAKARESLAATRATFDLIVSDLLDLELPEPVDVVFSNATFHWILDHRRLFERLHAALRPGGRMEAQCGGIGNVDEFLQLDRERHGDERFAPYLRRHREHVEFRLAPATRRCASRAPGSSPCGAGSRSGPCSPRTRARSSRPCVSARTWTGCPESSAAVHGRGARGRPAPADARLRAAQHLGEPAVTW